MTDIRDDMDAARAALNELKRTRPRTDAEARKRSVDLVRLEKLCAANGSKERFSENVPAGINPETAPSSPTERRAVSAEVRAKGRRLEGYAATFGVEARISDFVETIAPGAFAATLAERADILALVDHDPRLVLARTRSKTLRLAEDSRGLAFDLDVPATTTGSDVLALAERGDIGGASFAFTVKKEFWDGERRTLESVDLHEISVVSAWPAYEQTVVQARSRLVLFPRVAVARRFLETL